MANPENLKPFPKGISGNPKGRAKGVKNWSTIVHQLLADENLMEKISSKKPSYWNELPIKNAANAVVTAMIIKALQGDTKAAAWITKTGYGNKVDITSHGERIDITPVIVSTIEARNTNAEAETETEPSSPAS